MQKVFIILIYNIEKSKCPQTDDYLNDEPRRNKIGIKNDKYKDT